MRRMSSFRPKISWITMTAGRRSSPAGRASAACIGRPLEDGNVRSTVVAIGSPAPERDQVVPERVHRRALLRVHDDGREGLLDDRRAEDRLPRREARPVVYRRGDEAAGEERLPR